MDADALRQATALWDTHVQRPFPDDASGQHAGGHDLVLLDAETAGYIATALGSRGANAQSWSHGLRDCSASLREVVAATTGEVKDYFASLLDVAEAVQGAADVAPDAREMFKELPWPFEGDEFPPHLGAVVMKTVLSGEQPAREVIHTFDNEWLVADGVNDPNAPDACLATHVSHVVQRNSSVARLATLPPGHTAFRGGRGEPWTVEPWTGWEDEEPSA